MKVRLEKLIDWFPVPNGSTLIEQGTPANFAAFVLEGSFDVFRRSTGGSRFISSATAGEVLGEVGLLTKSSRFATCNASQDSVVGVLSQNQLIAMRKDDLELYAGLLTILGATSANRLTELTTEVDLLSAKNEIAVQSAKNILRSSMLG